LAPGQNKEGFACKRMKTKLKKKSASDLLAHADDVHALVDDGRGDDGSLVADQRPGTRAILCRPAINVWVAIGVRG
jgi:hypothetical protein